MYSCTDIDKYMDGSFVHQQDRGRVDVGLLQEHPSQWYHLLNARFRYGPFEVVRLANQTTFLGSGGLHAGYC